MKLFRVVKPGFFTTVQDLGRFGFLKYGVPISGAMDEFSLRLANMLLANNSNDACLEITLIGPELEALTDTQIAVTGADITLQINGAEVEMWQTQRINKGECLSFGKIRNGCRTYLAIRGGINVPIVLGSRSTYTRSEIGGFRGKQLKAEDIIEAFASTKPLHDKLSLPESLTPKFADKAYVNVLLGPQTESFTEKGVESFISNLYTISLEADRMGYRLEGPIIEQRTQQSLISDAILPGAVQVPPDGKPIIMMQDAQTTGGYAKIAVVATPDLHILGQAKPRDTIHFHSISLAEARRRLLDYMKGFDIIKRKLRRSAF